MTTPTTRKPTTTRPTIDALAAKWTCSADLADLCSGSDYTPTLYAVSGHRDVRGSKAELKRLADAYDRFQRRRGDKRRAYRA